MVLKALIQAHSLLQASSIFNTFYWLHFHIGGGVVFLLIVSVSLLWTQFAGLLLDISRIWLLNLLSNGSDVMPTY